MSFFNILKNTMLLLIFLQFAPILINGIKKQYEGYFEPKTYVGITPFKGTIIDSSWHLQQLSSLFKDQDIKAIVLKIDCNGTPSGTGEALYREIKFLKKEHSKPVIALVENVCTSGAYWIACASDYIIAPGTSVIGSIGVKNSENALDQFFLFKDFINQLHIRTGQVGEVTTKVKAETPDTDDDSFVNLSEEDKKLFQDMLSDFHRQFIEEVASARKLSLAKAHEWANGKIFTGHQALNLGLIDEIGSFSNVMGVVKKKALVEGEIEWVHPYEPKGILSLLSGFSASRDGSANTAQALDTTTSFLEKIVKVGTMVV